MKSNQYTKHQHTITKSYLSGFADKQGKVFWYDKLEKRIKNGNIKSATVVDDFYSKKLESGELDDSIEKFLSKIENPIAKLIIEIFEDYKVLFEPVRAQQLSDFLSYLPVRTTWFKKKSQEVRPRMLKDKEKFITEGIASIDSEMRKKGYYLTPKELKQGSEKVFQELFTELQSDEYYLDSMPRHQKMWQNIINSRNWHIIKISKKRSFVTSDNPFFLGNNPISTDFYEKPLPIPLNRHMCLVLGSPGNNLFLNYLINPKHIREVNVGMFANAERYVISDSRDLLESLSQQSTLF